jgi:hypothetical protein
MKNIIFIIIVLVNYNLFADIGGNSSSVISNTDTLIYSSFENGFEGWSPVNIKNPGDPTIWRVASNRATSGNHSMGWSDSVSNSYPHGLREALISPQVTLPNTARSFVKFKAYVHLTLNGTYYHDYFLLQYSSNNGTSWNNIMPYAFSGQHPGWLSYPENFGPTASAEITHLRGRTLIFRFLTGSDTLDPNGLGLFIDDFVVYANNCDFEDPNEPNNSIAMATPVTLGQTISASLCPQNDEDFYKFNANAGDQITIATQHSAQYTYLYFYNPSGFTILSAYNEFNYTIPTTGTYTVRVTGVWSYALNYTIYFNSLNPHPDVISVADIPEDQGLKVRIKWQASYYDPQNTSGQIKEYQLWRKMNQDSLKMNGKGLKRVDVSDLASVELNGNNIYLIQNEYWDYIATIPSLTGRPNVNYSYVAQTLEDNVMTYFKVAAIPKNENSPVLWGAEGGGISEDNVTPQLGSLTATGGNGRVKVKWDLDRGANPDIISIELYKGVYEYFPPAEENKIAIMDFMDDEYVDYEIREGYKYFYRLLIKERNGRISLSDAVPMNSGVLSADGEIVPAEYTLLQNYPNPFNPSTTITYALPSEADVSIKVYDILGNMVAEIVNEKKGAGVHKVELKGDGLSSGVYLYKLSAGDFNSVKKMILMK